MGILPSQLRTYYLPTMTPRLQTGILQPLSPKTMESIKREICRHEEQKNRHSKKLNPDKAYFPLRDQREIKEKNKQTQRCALRTIVIRYQYICRRCHVECKNK